MSEARVRKYRAAKAKEQHHCCFYCGFPMWSDSAQSYVARHHVSPAEAKRFLCTAEHKLALCEGGTSRQDNIVAACLFCNVMRHRRRKPLPAEQYQVYVRGRVSKQAWHPQRLHKLIEPVAIH